MELPRLELSSVLWMTVQGRSICENWKVAEHILKPVFPPSFVSYWATATKLKCLSWSQGHYAPGGWIRSTLHTWARTWSCSLCRSRAVRPFGRPWPPSAWCRSPRTWSGGRARTSCLPSWPCRRSLRCTPRTTTAPSCTVRCARRVCLSWPLPLPTFSHWSFQGRLSQKKIMLCSFLCVTQYLHAKLERNLCKKNFSLPPAVGWYRNFRFERKSLSAVPFFDRTASVVVI